MRGEPATEQSFLAGETESVFEITNWNTQNVIHHVLGMLSGNFLKVYLVIKLWYFLIVSSGFFESGCVQYFFIKRNKLYNLNYS